MQLKESKNLSFFFYVSNFAERRKIFLKCVEGKARKQTERKEEEREGKILALAPHLKTTK
jgi:hypothetical protein